MNKSYNFSYIKQSFKGDIFTDELHKIAYATDASIYREKPIGVAYPKDETDIKLLIDFANANFISLIPRSGGTSLAGQCVGDGLVVDVSKYMNQLLEVNIEKKYASVEPGIIRDELNHYLNPYGFLFGPDTSTANRATIGGMVGNNSSGNFSIVYHTTREHILEIEALLSDGKKVIFKNYNRAEIDNKRNQNDIEGKIYNTFIKNLSQKHIQNEIAEAYPHPSIHRRNTGYAIDLIANQTYFTGNNATDTLNLCPMICGSEGTLCFITKIKVNIEKLPPPYAVLVCSHFKTLHESLKSAVFVMKHKPSAVELTDKYILDCSKSNILQEKNTFFLVGDPEALILNEIRDNTIEKALNRAELLVADLQENKLGYAHPIISDPKQVKQVWDFRKASLGILSNMPGKAKPVAVVEDTAVELSVLPEYIQAFDNIMENMNQKAVHFAHAGAGEIHIRPLLNLRLHEDKKALRKIGEASAHLVKKFNGSLSGEHGDGRVRAEFIPIVYGKNIYDLLRTIKYSFDENNIFNRGKIVDSKPMDSDLRYDISLKNNEIITSKNISVFPAESVIDFGEIGGMLSMAEKCNGSGDCRKLPLSGGGMCPSYQATRNEKDTTRARANILREFLTRSPLPNRLNHKEIYDVLEYCISCKACASECPSNVDMSLLKAEFLHHYYKDNSPNWRTKLFVHFSETMRLASFLPSVSNFLLKNNFISSQIKNATGIAKGRSFPNISDTTWINWFLNRRPLKNPNPIKTVYLFFDEFINFNESHIGVKAILLLERLGYEVKMVSHEESGRAALSKGFLNLAKKYAEKNVEIFSEVIHSNCMLIGIEPSCILSFKDEYPKLVDKKLKSKAERLAENCCLIDDFIYNEWIAGNINQNLFTEEKKRIKFHGHCHQKSIGNIAHSLGILGIPKNYEVMNIPSGCCGMAGSFGYEAEHFEVSNKIAELVLFPELRKENEYDLIAANGTSCRHQVKDGLNKLAMHPIEILYNAIK